MTKSFTSINFIITTNRLKLDRIIGISCDALRIELKQKYEKINFKMTIYTSTRKGKSSPLINKLFLKVSGCIDNQNVRCIKQINTSSLETIRKLLYLKLLSLNLIAILIRIRIELIYPNCDANRYISKC
ncbi:hypothetical protein BpHYR1_048099 [Brachionus plicatilis]|uniref:Uncharacterized protein n=1 Tax=Brachionus plicatilis TaxID=10195 RepID=A0A3M7R766_BRAPC|nr:hypothetical protein BpHYR1_048099 [Brachionus plicatilis]